MCRVAYVYHVIAPFVLLWIVIVCLVGCETQETIQMEKNKAAARRFWEEGWKRENQALFDEICVVNFVNHDPTLPHITTLDAYEKHVALHTAAFSADAGVRVEDMIAEADKVAVRWTWNAIHDGQYMGIQPTGNEVTMTGITIHRFVENKVVENWHNYDALGLLQQLGRLPTLGREDFTWGTSIERGAADPGTPEKNRDLYMRELEDVWLKKNVAAVDELFATDFANHDPSWPSVVDRESYKEWATRMIASGPDMQIPVDMIVAEGDMVAARWTSAWTDTVGSPGVPPTGDKIVVTGTDIIRCADGKIAERWWAKYLLCAMRQLGVIEMPPPPAPK